MKIRPKLVLPKFLADSLLGLSGQRTSISIAIDNGLHFGELGGELGGEMVRVDQGLVPRSNGSIPFVSPSP
jgi:hypothetical protein